MARDFFFSDVSKKIFLKHENFQFRKKRFEFLFSSLLSFEEVLSSFQSCTFFVDSGMSPRKKTFCFGRADFFKKRSNIDREQNRARSTPGSQRIPLSKICHRPGSDMAVLEIYQLSYLLEADRVNGSTWL